MRRVMFLVTLSAGLGIGCGDGTIKGHNFAGKVTLDGEPVAAGVVLLIPDPAKGNSGPQGLADIKNGQYDTKENQRGYLGGGTIVRIEGQDKQGTPLFFYEAQLDLPRGSESQDFHLKKTDVKPPSKD
jgi:hypothetical protein